MQQIISLKGISVNSFWPILLIVFSNIAYNLTARSIPEKANSFLSLTITYLVGMFLSLLLYLLFSGSKDIAESFGKLNWASYILGLAIVGLETGFILMYRAGWKISIGPLVANIFLSIALIILGTLFFKEQLNTKQILGILLCIGGLLLINL